MDFKNGVATFVMPHFREENNTTKKWLDETLEHIFKQSDPNWHLVIIDDLSPSGEAIAYLEDVKAKHPDKITVIKKETNNGPGYCRNLGIKWAFEHNSPIVLFNDADDISDIRRLEVARKIFTDDPDASVVYSTFKVIDEESKIVPMEKLTQSIVEILEGHQHNPPQGMNAWIDIGTLKGYTNLTSATVVKTELAFKYPFPPEKVSEDSNAWMRYSAGGGKFVYSGEIPTLYRIPQHTAGSSSRTREGGKHGFYIAKARVDTDGFTRALEIALTNGKVALDRRDDLLIKFYLKLGETLYRENELDLAQKQVEKAALLDKDLTKKVIAERNFGNWARLE
ncbi:MAG: glycosyltransferase family 2 protein [Spirochaetales bacterium]|nr:glycosyltransferase family 2 protein [Spirochaetales bacterium]